MIVFTTPRPDRIASPMNGAQPRVSVTCFGRFQVLVGDKPVIDWRSTKARALFQFLVNHHDRLVSPSVLIEALWPNPNAAAPQTSLKVAVHGLRHTLAGLGQPPLTIQAHNPGYSLGTSGLWLDVEEFESCYGGGRSLEAQGLGGKALALYERATELYRGDFLEEILDEWPSFRREALKDQYLFMATRLVRAAIEDGDYQGALVRCQQILSKDRCREDVYRMLFTCHARMGQRGRVRHWWEFCVRSLEVELDCSPSPETEEVYRLALTGEL